VHRYHSYYYTISIFSSHLKLFFLESDFKISAKNSKIFVKNEELGESVYLILDKNNRWWKIDKFGFEIFKEGLN